MNSNQQRSIINTGVTSAQATQQNTLRPQHRGFSQLQQPTVSTTPAMSQMSQFQTQAQQHQQSMMVAGAYQKLNTPQQQQNGSDFTESMQQYHQYMGGNSSLGLPSQNGNHQAMSGLTVDGSNQVSHTQYQMKQRPLQKHQQGHQYQQQQRQVHHIHQSVQQPQQQHLHQQMQQQKHSSIPHVNQVAGYQPQQHSQSQNHNAEQHKSQRQHHHQRHQHQQIQPKYILQNPLHAKVAVSVNQQQPKAPLLEPQEPPLVIDTFSANGTADMDGDCGVDQAQVEEKSPNSEDAKSNDTSEASEEQSLANTKEKTPMCLINELARFNKVSHQYTLVDEQGPAHKKIFYVKLKLGDEEYSASGESIKKAQHAAAAIALVETGHPHPTPKPPRYSNTPICHPDENITPTVELNALAMKRGEATFYKAIEPQQPSYFPQPGMDFRGMYNQRYHQFMRANRDPRFRGGGVPWPMRYYCPRMNRAFYVSLRVGHREFIGDGPTRQAARHNAAQKALRILRNLPIKQPTETNEESPADGEESSGAKTKDAGESEEGINIDGLKSEISLVHEIALRRNMLVTFEVIRETGPPHMKTFVTRCTVSDKVTEGEGNSKKTSKKRAAELMLEELNKLPSSASPAGLKPKGKVQINKKKNRNLIKSELQQQKADPNYGVGINPISRLIQIMQAQKKKEPVYSLVAERGLPRRREFVMQVQVEDKTCTGSGPNKKLAKRAAAEAMLLELGYTKPSPQPIKSSIKTASSSGEGNHSNGDKKVHFVGDPGVSEKDITTAAASSHQLATSSAAPIVQQQQRVPGLLHLPPGSSSRPTLTSAPLRGPAQPQPREQLVNLASILKPSLRPEIQLRELCKAMDQELEIDDFTKKKKPSGTEHITRISIGREPNQQNFHGSGTTLESSRDMAALDALKMLLGRVKELHPGGDGPQVKKELLTRTSLSLKKDMK